MIKFSWIRHCEEWKKSAHKEITQLESKGTWVEVPTSEATSKILPGTWAFIARELLQESSPSSRQNIVSEVTYKKTYQKPMHQLYHGTQSGSYLSSPLAKNGFSSVWTSTMPLSKLTSKIQSRCIFPQDTDPFKSTTPTCLRLKKSLYGLSVAPKLWYQYL